MRSKKCRNLNVCIWQDTRPVVVLSSHNSPGKTAEIRRKKKDGAVISIPCPSVIIDYNKYMGGIDHNDQLRQYYHVRQKCRKYYKYIFWFLFDVSLTNSFILSRFNSHLSSTIKNIKEFRIEVAKALIGTHSSRKRAGRRSITIPRKKFCHQHFPNKGDGKQHRCYFCSHFLHRRRETTWFCKDCETYLCHNGKEDDCFFLYHTQHGPDIVP